MSEKDRKKQIFAGKWLDPSIKVMSDSEAARKINPEIKDLRVMNESEIEKAIKEAVQRSLRYRKTVIDLRYEVATTKSPEAKLEYDDMVHKIKKVEQWIRAAREKLAELNKASRIAKSESEDKILVTILRRMVGEDGFKEAICELRLVTTGAKK